MGEYALKILIERSVTLFSVKSALPYYFHLGFKQAAQGPCNESQDLILENEDLHAFLLNHGGRAWSTF